MFLNNGRNFLGYSNRNTVVHTEATNLQKPPQSQKNADYITPPKTYHSFLSSRNPDEVTAVNAFYEKIDFLYDKNYSERLNNCSNYAYFAIEKKSKKIVVLSSKCKLRWCPLCRKKKTSLITHNVTDWLKAIERPKFMTLTLKSSDAPLAHQVKYLYKYFVNFRRLKEIKQALRGGVWFFQITYNRHREQFHPHLHCLIDCDYIAHSDLSRAWLRTTASSKVVDIKSVKDPEKTASYVARYSASPLNLKDFPPDTYSEIFEAFRGLRICGTWGTGRSICLTVKPEPDKSKFKTIGSWAVIAAMIRENPDALEIWKCFLSGKPYTGNADFNELDRFISGCVESAVKKAEQLYLDYG